MPGIVYTNYRQSLVITGGRLLRWKNCELIDTMPDNSVVFVSASDIRRSKIVGLTNIQGGTFAALLTHLSAERFTLPLDRSYCNDLPSGIHRICTAPLEQILLPCCSNRYDKGILPRGTEVHRSLNVSYTLDTAENPMFAGYSDGNYNRYNES